MDAGSGKGCGDRTHHPLRKTDNDRLACFRIRRAGEGANNISDRRWIIFSNGCLYSRNASPGAGTSGVPWLETFPAFGLKAPGTEDGTDETVSGDLPSSSVAATCPEDSRRYSATVTNRSRAATRRSSISGMASTVLECVS